MLFTRDRNFYKTILLLAIPMVLQNLITFSVGLADNLMIGKLGDSAVAGVYIGNQIQTVLQVLNAGIESAILLISSQYWGRRDIPSIQKIISIGFWISFIIGLIFTLVTTFFTEGVVSIFTNEADVIENGVYYVSFLCYSYVFFCMTQALIVSMRSVESAFIGMMVSSCSLVIDVGLNYLLIFGKLGFPKMGVCGAALATLISRVCEFLIIFVYVRYVDKKLHFRFSMLRHIDKGLLRDFVKYGTPLIAGQLVWGTNLAANSLILGHYTEAVITGVSLANTLNNMMYVALNGLAGAIGVVIGKKVGAGQTQKIREYANTVQISLFILGLFVSLCFTLLKNPFISLYDISDDAIKYSRQFITVLSITCIGSCYQCGSLFGLVKSGGDVSFVFKNDTVAIFCVVLPISIAASLLGAPVWVVFFCLKLDQIFKCVVAFFKIRKYNWMKNLTKDTATV